jgi:hypothetical protein
MILTGFISEFKDNNKREPSQEEMIEGNQYLKVIIEPHNDLFLILLTVVAASSFLRFH